MLAIVKPKIKPTETKEDKEANILAHRFSRFIMTHDIKILIGSTFFIIAIGAGLLHVKVDSNTVRYFSENVAFRETVNFMQKNISGPMSYEIVVDSKVKDGIKDPQFMNKVEEFYTVFREKYPDMRHISSLTDVVKKFNEVMDGSYTIPNDRNLIAQYLLLYSLSLPQGMEINDKMDVEERLLRVSAAINIVDTSKDLEMMRWVENWWDKTPYSAKINGQTAMFAHMQHDVTDTLINSIMLAIIAVSIMMLFIFRNLRMIPLFIIPNILPIVLVVGVMGWLGLTIDIGVAISGAIIIGVAVDDTIHFLVKYREARRRGDSLEEALVYVMQYAGSAIIFTTIILSLAFVIFVFSDFLPNVHFGVVTSIALVIAVWIDLLVLPAVLSRFDNAKKSLLVN
jgi:predicted RND superfamily exporter protein